MSKSDDAYDKEFIALQTALVRFQQDAIASRISAAGERIEDAVCNRGGQIATQITDTADRLTKAVSIDGAALAQTLTTTTEQIGSVLTDRTKDAQALFQAAGDDMAGKFVTQSDRRFRGKLAFEQVAVGAADAAGLDLDQNLARRHTAGAIVDHHLLAQHRAEVLRHQPGRLRRPTRCRG